MAESVISKTSLIREYNGTITVSNFTFTATNDGICTIIIVPESQNSHFYVRDKTTGVPISRGSGTGGSSYGLTFPLFKNHSYTIDSSAGIDKIIRTIAYF